MKLVDLADEAALALHEREDHANNLERAILRGYVKRPFSDVAMMRSRLPMAGGVARAVRLLAAWRDRLPAEFIAELEREDTRLR